jgi:nuclear cap-binding protein subunit 2
MNCINSISGELSSSSVIYFKMSELFHSETTSQRICWDRKYYSDFDDQLNVLKNSRTVYVGNLSFYTTESQIHETFSVVGPIKSIIMGLNNITKTPCGFCFIEYYTREHTNACLKYLTDTIIDDRMIRCDLDGGYRPGREFGRGKSGGQIRDERRRESDPSRGDGIVSSLGKHRRVEIFDDFGRDKRPSVSSSTNQLSTSRF